MSEQMSVETQEALVDLQIRLTHQEAAIESLTQNFLALEKHVLAMDQQLRQMQTLIKELTPSLVAPQDQELPPPHY